VALQGLATEPRIAKREKGSKFESLLSEGFRSADVPLLCTVANARRV